MEQKEDDPGCQSPRCWTRLTKIMISTACVVACLIVLMANSLYVPSIPGVREHFHLGTTMAALPITLYTLGFVIGPAFGTAFSEVVGRYPVLQISLLGSLLSTALAGAAGNVAMLLAGRALAGICASPCSSVLAGVLNDLWDPTTDELGSFFIALYVVIGCVAPLVGPVSGVSVVADTGEWQWTFWLSCILLGLAMALTIGFPETQIPDSTDHGTDRFRRVLRIGMSRPLHMIAVEPIMLPTALYGSVVQSLLFFFYVAFPHILEFDFRLSPYTAGLCFLPMLGGCVLALPVVMLLEIACRSRVGAAKSADVPQLAPERRLWSCVVGSILLPISLFWYTWTAQPGTHWIVPTMSGIFFGCSFTLILLGIIWYKNDVYGARYGASALAADTLIRYAVSSVFPLFAVSLLEYMHTQRALTVLAVITLVLVPVPWCLRYWGPSLRARGNDLYRLQP